MKKVAIIYWSGTGNTEAMANAVAEGVNSVGGEATVLTPDAFDSSMISNFDSFAFGCPAMGAEVLEESEFQPMWDACSSKLTGRNAALFGSYGWGDGEWMREWEDSCKSSGINLIAESIICNDYPGDDTISDCKNLGSQLAR